MPQPLKLFEAHTKIFFKKTSYCSTQLVSVVKYEYMTAIFALPYVFDIILRTKYLYEILPWGTVIDSGVVIERHIVSKGENANR